VPPSELECVLSVAGADDVDYSACVLLLVETLQHQEVALRLFIVDQVISARASLGQGALRPQN